ncbi:hypothetical protein ACYHMY_28455 (plasmid) [Pseudomonas amygdali pv. morsprunorum]
MKTIVGMFWGVMGGLFLACGVIVFTHLVGAGSNLLGFTEWTFRYYMLCLGVCIALLAGSRSARKHSALMMVFFVAVMMVIGVGFQTFMEVSSGQDQVERMQQNLMAMALIMAKAVMYVAPGALTAFYAFVAFNGLSNPAARKPSTDYGKVEP